MQLRPRKHCPFWAALVAHRVTVSMITTAKDAPQQRTASSWSQSSLVMVFASISGSSKDVLIASSTSSTGRGPRETCSMQCSMHHSKRRPTAGVAERFVARVTFPPSPRLERQCGSCADRNLPRGAGSRARDNTSNAHSIQKCVCVCVCVCDSPSHCIHTLSLFTSDVSSRARSFHEDVASSSASTAMLSSVGRASRLVRMGTRSNFMSAFKDTCAPLASAGPARRKTVSDR